MTWRTTRATARAGEVEPDPLPFDGDQPERGEQWAPGGVPPTGIEFLGCRGTSTCWLAPCPSCGRGWVPVVPDGTEFGYRFAVEVGCSAGCEPALTAWWHAWRLGELPPQAAPDDRAWRYATAAVRRQLLELPDRPTRERLSAAAYAAGGWAAAGELDVEPIAFALLTAARRGGIDDPDIADKLATAFMAGRARPGRVPA